MGYAWREESEREGTMAARVPAGQHRLRIIQLRYGDRHGVYRSRDDDQQMMVILQDSQARETTMFITLSERAAWTLAKLMAACDPPVNLARMEADGVEPSHFADSKFAERVLLNRELVADVTYETDQKGKERAQVTPIRQRAANTPTSPPPAAEPPPSESPPVADDAPPAAAEPPPTSAIPTKPQTKDEAWGRVLKAWQGNADPEAKQRRNQTWFTAIQKVGKTEAQFTPDDWDQVVATCSIPF